MEKKIPSEISGAPICFNNKVILLSKSGIIFCIDPDGKLIWKKNLKVPVLSHGIIDKKGNIYIATIKNSLLSLTINGRIRWNLKTKNGFRNSPIIFKNRLYAADEKGILYSINSTNKKILWKKNLNIPIYSSPVFNPKSNSIIIPSKNFFLFAVSLQGKIKWKFKTKGVIFSSPAVTNEGSIYLTSMDHNLYKISQNGKLIWTFKTNKWIISSPAIDRKENIYFGSYDNYFYCIDSNGKLKWKYKGKGAFNSDPAIDSTGSVYCGDGSGTIYSFDRNGRVKWKYKTSDYIRGSFSIFSPKKLLLIGGLDTFIYAFQINGKISNKALWPKIGGNTFNNGFRTTQ